MATAATNKPKGFISFEGYFERTAKPIYALVYLLALIVFYELGLFLLNSDVFTRPLGEVPGVVVSFAWVYNALKLVGFNNQGAWVGAPVVVLATLIIWQLISNTKLSIRINDFFPMTLECLMWSVPLIILSLWINRMIVPETYMPVPALPQAMLSTGSNSNFMISIVAGIGAGIYEELFFRLYLIMILVLFMRKFLAMPEIRANCFAIVISALLFSLHHHIYFLGGSMQFGEPFMAAPFIFRFIAGMYLAILFGLRGFGVVAATHAYHNVLAAVINHIF